jgi:hypothetical protein
MAGEKNLSKLLLSMNPQLLDGDYVFCTVKKGKYGDYQDLSPLGCYQEVEGLTLILRKEQADLSELKYDSVLKGITLAVHSSLKAVGLTAIVAQTLAAKGISANVIAGYYHDHIFVPAKKADIALDALKQLQLS